LLHCLLEKDLISDRHRATLQDLAGYADPDGALGAAVARSCPPDRNPGLLVSAAAAGHWEELEEIREPLRRGWLRVNRGDVIRARLLRMRRILNGPRTVLKRRGISVVLLGANGAGKSTVAEAVLRGYPDASYLCYLGLWKQERPTGRARAALRVLARPGFVWSRYATSLAHRARGELVLFDRYVYDAFLPPQPPLVWLKRPYLWVLAHSCPAPTLTVILDVPGEVAWRRKGENSVAESEQERRELLALRHRLNRVHVVDATRPLDEVVADVTALVWDRYARRWLRPEGGSPSRAVAPAGGR
jgi:thymidylate kinase